MLKTIWEELMKSLKGIGVLSMTEDEIIALVPKDSMRFEDIANAVNEMRVGESRDFTFNPLDPVFGKPSTQLVQIMMIQSGHSTIWATWKIQPKRGVYNLNILVS